MGHRSTANLPALIAGLRPKITRGKQGLPRFLLDPVWTAMNGRIVVFAAISITAMGAALSFALARGWLFAPPASFEDHIMQADYETMRPLFEARYVAKLDGHPWLCTDNNFAHLPRRDPVLEGLAIFTVERFWEKHGSIRPYSHGHYRDGDSPWGIFAQEALKEKMLPVLKEAKPLYIELVRKYREPDSTKPQ